MPKDPLAAKLKNTLIDPSVPMPEEPPALTEQTDSLLEGVARTGRTLDIQAKIPTASPAGEPDPNMQRVWDMTYNAALNSIFAKGLSHYNGSLKLLNDLLEKAVIRADEATEAYIRVRHVSQDPTQRALQDWQKKKFQS